MKHLTLGLVIGIFLITVLVFILPVDIVYKVPVTTKVYPVKQWSLIQNQSDFYTQTVIRSKEGASPVQNFVFERGDVVDIRLAPDLFDGKIIEKDSTLLVFTSQALNLRIQQAMNERSIQFSNLRAEQSAMKVPLFEEAQGSVDLAKANLLLQTLNLDRLTKLYEDGVISKMELDVQTNAHSMAAQELRMAEKRLTNTTFEGKPEDVEVFATRMATADKELEILLMKEKTYEVKAPFTGRVSLNPSEGVLVSISDIDTKSLVFPFPIGEKDVLTKESSLVLEKNGKEFTFPFELQENADMIAGRQYILGTAINNEMYAEYGEVLMAYVRCDTVQIGDYVLRKLRGNQ